jgi:multiple sugar transport system ATP-binding protein
MDEPLSNLDAKLRGQMRVELTKLHQRLKTTFIYVTHDQVEAMTMGTRIVVMRAGFIQQVDPPQIMYDNPNNMYVAGFIGTPQMNFIHGTLIEKNNEVWIDMSGTRIKFSEKRAKNVIGKGYDGKEVILGIRPEHFHDEQMYLDQMPDTLIEVKIDVVEMMGPEALLYFSFAKSNIIARVSPATKARPGMIIKIAIDTVRIHIFDKETEKAVFAE